MSNVLIGIVGVMLFIGLALAGALFLRPRFQEARSTSVAAAQVRAMQQIVNANDLIRVEEQGSISDDVRVGAAGSTQLVQEGYPLCIGSRSFGAVCPI